ncbi:MAG: FlgD immunoglobulin-like domain containing protein, partial [Candidatus Eisenbacteria bacterium]|nr:FlgD immunoglobulin-like domain containing protein [Candidatus Eisenbacteria bacterium]
SATPAVAVGTVATETAASRPATPPAPWDPTGADSLYVSILGSYPVVSATGIWSCCAYVAPGGHEYAILGADSLHVVDLADPTHPRRVRSIPPATDPATHYYVHVDVYDHYVYAASRHGPIVIVDMANPQDPLVVGTIPQNEFCACSCGHPCDDPSQAEIETIFIDERGILYVTGIRCGEGIQMFDLEPDPAHPRWLCHEHTGPAGDSYYAHDVHARDGVLYVSRSRAQPPRWDILDGDPLCPSSPGECGDGQTPALVASFRHEGPDLHAHSAWRLEDPSYLLTCDEKTNGHVRVWNIADLASPQQVAEIWPDQTCHSVHNVYVRDSIAYGAWYNKGIQVFDVSDPAHPQRVGYYEHPARWSSRPGDACCDPTLGADAHCHGIPYIDPFFRSDIFIASEIDFGLLVGRFHREPMDARAPAPPEESARRGELRLLTGPGTLPARIVWQAPEPEGETGAGAGARTAPALSIHNAAGRVVASVFPLASASGERALYEWDGTDPEGRRLPAGVYFVRADAMEEAGGGAGDGAGDGASGSPRGGVAGSSWGGRGPAGGPAGSVKIVVLH